MGDNAVGELSSWYAVGSGRGLAAASGRCLVPASPPSPGCRGRLTRTLSTPLPGGLPQSSACSILCSVPLVENLGGLSAASLHPIPCQTLKSCCLLHQPVVVTQLRAPSPTHLWAPPHGLFHPEPEFLHGKPNQFSLCLSPSRGAQAPSGHSLCPHSTCWI